MCMGGCGKKTGGSGSYAPKKSFFPKTKAASRGQNSTRGAINNNNFGTPKVRMSFGRKS